MKNMNIKCGKNKKGITLVALVVTIVVLLILAGVSLNLLIGNNGIITRAKQAKISNDLSSYKEQLAMFIADKKAENPEFYESSLTAGKNNLYYNTKTEEDEKTIKDIINDVKDEYLDSLEVVKGKLTINTQDKDIIKVAQAVGVEPNPYVIKDGELISSNGNLLLVDENGTLTLPDSVTKIGEGAFSNVEGLKTIIIPGTVKTIGTDAFRDNTTLEKVVMQEGVETIGIRAFNACANLTEVTLPDSLKTIQSQAFMHCKKLAYIEIPANIEKIDEYVFSLSGLANIKLRGNKIKSIEKEAFFGCPLIEFTITKDVENINSTAFDHCTELANIKIDTQNSKFIYQNGLLMPSTKESILYVLTKYYENSTTFEIPEGVVDFTCNIQELKNITKLVIPATTASINTRNLPTNIKEVEIAATNENLKTSEDCIYTKTEPETLLFCYSKATEIELQEPAKVIGKYAFNGATKATMIELNEKTEKIESQVFSTCYNLKNVEIGKSVSSINPIFALGNYNINLTINTENPNYVMDDGVLYNKNKDTIITVLKRINGKFELKDSVKIIRTQAFKAQAGMTEINLNKASEIGYSVFEGCNGLKKIEIPSTITKIDSRAFDGATEVSQIIIHRKENAIAGSPFGSPFGLRAIQWVGEN